VLLPFDLPAIGQDGADLVIGSDRIDRIATGDGDDWVSGKGGADRINAGDGDDVVLGGAGRDRIQGGDGDDHLSGGDGQDRIDGGDGDDRIAGDAGTDRLTGGEGHDVFVYGPDSDTDRIRDFTLGDDRIDLAAMGVTHFDELDIRATNYGVRIEFGGDSEIQIEGLSLGQLSADDFVFA
jgi:Ca2+-binding RTX toxin-like protein